MVNGRQAETAAGHMAIRTICCGGYVVDGLAGRTRQCTIMAEDTVVCMCRDIASGMVHKRILKVVGVMTVTAIGTR
jgi:hypothetical protein